MNRFLVITADFMLKPMSTWFQMEFINININHFRNSVYLVCDSYIECVLVHGYYDSWTINLILLASGVTCTILYLLNLVGNYSCRTMTSFWINTQGVWSECVKRHNNSFWDSIQFPCVPVYVYHVISLPMQFFFSFTLFCNNFLCHNLLHTTWNYPLHFRRMCTLYCRK